MYRGVPLLPPIEIELGVTTTRHSGVIRKA